MWERLFLIMLGRFVAQGTLQVKLPSGRTETFGDDSVPVVNVQFHSWRALRSIVLRPELGIGEAYMDQQMTLIGCDLHDFFRLLIRNISRPGLSSRPHFLRRLNRGFKRFSQNSPLSISRKNVAHHYNISTSFYDLFLSFDRLYTCAYYSSDSMSLEQAQEAKINHIAKKLMLVPGQRVLDIGFGWGYMACYLAKHYHVHVTGVTLSKSQLETANRVAAEMGVEDRVEFRLQDYREVPETFDRVYSVGMLEHVGQPQYSTYFSKLNALLNDDGLATIQFIGRATPPSALSPWFNKYIFPGGYAPALSEVTSEVEKSGLIAADIEVWRGHYERTLDDWTDRFERNATQVEEMFDARFVRMWRYYLIASKLSFSEMKHVLFQYQISKDPYAVPMTRNYLYQERDARQGTGPVSVVPEPLENVS